MPFPLPRQPWPALTSLPASAQVDPKRILDQFEATFGKFEGFRRSGAKGVCAVGEFTGSVEGRALSVASAFSGKPVPVVARFSVGGANPKAPDNLRGQRNMALQFNLPGGEVWQPLWLAACRPPPAMNSFSDRPGARINAQLAIRQFVGQLSAGAIPQAAGLV